MGGSGFSDPGSSLPSVQRHGCASPCNPPISGQREAGPWACDWLLLTLFNRPGLADLLKVKVGKHFQNLPLLLCFLQEAVLDHPRQIRGGQFLESAGMLRLAWLAHVGSQLLKLPYPRGGF